MSTANTATDNIGTLHRLMKYVQKTDTCWNWKGAKNDRGYGIFSHERKRKLAHRVCWMLLVGEIQEGMFLCHHCDNPGCVNPNHIFVGTNQANMTDCLLKGRHWNLKKTHCKHGHEFSQENIYIYKVGRKTWRACRICIAKRNKSRTTNRKASI